MMFMNEFDVAQARQRFSAGDTPNLERGAETLSRLVEWTNSHSDGWAYWPKPCRAAKSLQALLTEADRFDPQDVTEAQLTAAFSPIKAFLTRQGQQHSEVFV